MSCQTYANYYHSLKKLSLEQELVIGRAVRGLDSLENWAEEEPYEVQQREMESPAPVEE